MLDKATRKSRTSGTRWRSARADQHLFGVGFTRRKGRGVRGNNEPCRTTFAFAVRGSRLRRRNSKDVRRFAGNVGIMRLCCPLSANAGLLALLLCHATAGTVPEPYAERGTHAQRLELCRFVLRRDSRWSLVLAQPVKSKAVARALYHWDASVDEDVRTRLRPIWDDAVAVTPLDVLQKAMNELSWIGSYVQYALMVLREAFTCVVYVHLTKIVELIEALQESQASEDGDRGSYVEASLVLVMLANKLAAVDGNVEPIRDLLNMFSRALVDRGKVSYPMIKMLRRQIDKNIDDNCERYEPVRAHADSGSREGTAAAPSAPKTPVGRFARSLFAFYGSLEVEVIHMETWSQAFNYRLPNAKYIMLGTAVDDLMRKDEARGKYKKMRSKLELQITEDILKTILNGNTVKESFEDEDDEDVLRFS